MFRKEKIRLVLFLFIFVGFVQCNVQNKEISHSKLFDLNWKFSYGNYNSASGVNFNDQNWRNLDLPHDWSNDKKLINTIETRSSPVSSDLGWYRKQFEIPENWKNKTIEIEFEGIRENAEIFINGVLIHKTEKADGSLKAVIAPYLNYDGNNIIAVSMASPKQTKNSMQPESGIYNHVWLVVKDSPNY